MSYRYFGNRDLKLPTISLGLWHNVGEVDSDTNAREITRGASDLGHTHFDLTNNYGPPPGSAEEAFDRILNQNF